MKKDGLCQAILPETHGCSTYGTTMTLRGHRTHDMTIHCIRIHKQIVRIKNPTSFMYPDPSGQRLPLLRNTNTKSLHSSCYVFAVLRYFSSIYFYLTAL